MHFLPRQLKRHSFSCCVSSEEGTFVCRRCGGCPLIIGDQFVKYAPTGTRYGRSKKIHKQSVGHPWPFLLCSPLSFSNRLALCPQSPQNCPQNGRMVRGVPLLFKTRSGVLRLCEDGKRQKSFLGSPAATEPGASSIQHGRVWKSPLSEEPEGRRGSNHSQLSRR